MKCEGFVIAVSSALALGLVGERTCLADSGATIEFLPIPEIGARSHDYVTRDSLSPDGEMVALPGRSYASPGNPGFWSEADGEVYYEAPGGQAEAYVLQFFEGGAIFGPGGRFMWERGVGFEEAINVFPGRDMMSGAWGISADGSTLVGFRYVDETYTTTAAMRWRRDGSADLIQTMEESPEATALRTSRDGHVVVGSESGANSSYTSFVWTPEDGRVDFIPTPEYSFFYATPLSEDGSTVVVHAITRTVNHRAYLKAYLWTRDGGIRDLGPAPTAPTPHEAFNDFEVAAISSDGSVVLGTMRVRDGNGSEEYSSQFLWTEPTGIIDAREYLQNAIATPYPDHLDYRVRIDEVIDMSADAKRFLVYGDFEDGSSEGDDGGAPRSLNGPCGDDPTQYSCPAFVTLPSGCAGDLDRDDDTDTADFGVFVSNLGTDTWPGTHGDLNRDWRVDVLDFAVLAANFGCETE